MRQSQRNLRQGKSCRRLYLLYGRSSVGYCIGTPSPKEAGTPAYEVLARYTGKELEFKEYEPLFDYAVGICEKQRKKAFYVTCDTYVTLTDGTGVVHIAPAFGEDDANVGRHYGLPFIQLVDGNGNMTAETPWAGTFVKKARPSGLRSAGKSWAFV